jgi:hypothetical protein
MIVIEGAQHTGKSTLANQLAASLLLPLRPNFAPYRGRGDFLLDKVIEDIHQWPSSYTGIYDGHPLINEYIYGPLQRSRLSEGFEDSCIRPIFEFFIQQSFIIYCRPPEDMITDVEALRYYDFLLRYPLIPTHCVEYDYTNPYGLNIVSAAVRSHCRVRDNLPTAR